MTVLVNATPGTLPPGFCPTGVTALQDLYNEFILKTQFSLSADKAFYNYGDVAPTPENRVFPWLQTSAGYPVRWWVYVAGAGYWLSPYPFPASSYLRQIWAGTEDQLDVYDGGEAAAVTNISGPFWEIDSVFNGRSPMGVGDIPTASPAKNLSLGEDFGEGATVLTGTQLPDISTLIKIGVAIPGTGHDSPGDGSTYDGGGAAINAGYTNDTAMYPSQQTWSNGFPKASVATLQTAVGEAHNTVHPVHGVYFIKRTARLYYRQ